MSVAAPPLTSQELVRFLLARVGEDESELKRLARHGTELSGVPGVPGVPGVLAISRQLAETAAKRRLIGALQQLLVLRDQPFEKAIRDQAAQMLRMLALPYEDHASYRPEWRPSGSH